MPSPDSELSDDEGTYLRYILGQTVMPYSKGLALRQRLERSHRIASIGHEAFRHELLRRTRQSTGEGTQPHALATELSEELRDFLRRAVNSIAPGQDLGEPSSRQKASTVASPKDTAQPKRTSHSASRPGVLLCEYCTSSKGDSKRLFLTLEEAEQIVLSLYPNQEPYPCPHYFGCWHLRTARELKRPQTDMTALSSTNSSMLEPRQAPAAAPKPPPQARATVDELVYAPLAKSKLSRDELAHLQQRLAARLATTFGSQDIPPQSHWMHFNDLGVIVDLQELQFVDSTAYRRAGDRFEVDLGSSKREIAYALFKWR